MRLQLETFFFYIKMKFVKIFFNGEFWSFQQGFFKSLDVLFSFFFMVVIRELLRMFCWWWVDGVLLVFWIILFNFFVIVLCEKYFIIFVCCRLVLGEVNNVFRMVWLISGRGQILVRRFGVRVRFYRLFYYIVFLGKKSY